MQILLDENLPHRLASYFLKPANVLTVSGCGWSGKKNGELLRLAEEEFDVLVTMDLGIEYQHNIANLKLGILVLSAPTNRLEDLAPLMPEANRLIEKVAPGKVQSVSSPG